jgi:hypothetical protein
MASLDKRADRVAQIKAQLDYHRQRLELYRRLHGSRPCVRLAELEHAYSSARDRLSDAEGPATPVATAPAPRTRG